MLSKPASSPPRQVAFAGCSVVPRTSATVLLYSAVFKRCMPLVPGSTTWEAPPEPEFASAAWPPVPSAAPGDPLPEHPARTPARTQHRLSRTDPRGDLAAASTYNLGAPEEGPTAQG